MSNNQSNLKNNFFDKIKNKKIFKNEIVLAVFNFALTLVTLIVLIAIMIASKSSNHITNIILVYALYLPIVLVNILLSVFISFSTAINHFDKFKKLWFFYLPFCTIFLEIFVLPIPLSLIAWLKPENINAGMLWSLIIFGFICLLLSILNLIFVYKNNLNSLIYVTSNEEDNENKQKVKPIENEQ